MKAFKLLIITLIIISWINSTNAFVLNSYYTESISRFIESPSEDDLTRIENNRLRNCEKVYLEATRRRDYTINEILICSDVFDVKRQEEIDYITYMFKNRGVY